MKLGTKEYLIALSTELSRLYGFALTRCSRPRPSNWILTTTSRSRPRRMV